jgi:hypothetical protein
MGWRDFQAAPPREFMESMESMNIDTPEVLLIPLIPLIPKESVSEQTDIFAPDYQNGTAPANKGRALPLYCESGGCHCSQKLPGNDCGDCEYLNNPRQAKEQTETIPATFEQTGNPASCPYWFQVCHAVDFYQDACTRCTECQMYHFLAVNS